LTIILDRAYGDLFVPYLENDRYIDLELKEWKEEVLPAALLTFFTFVANRMRTVTKRGGRTIVLTDVPPTALHEKTFTQSLFSAGDSSPVEAEVEKEGDEIGVPTMDTFVGILARHVEGVNRARQLVPVGMLPIRISGLFRLLLDVLEVYLIPSLHIAIEDFREVVDYDVLKVTRVALDILLLVQLHFERCISKDVIPSPGIHREIILDKNEVFAGVERLCCDLVEKVVRVCGKELARILSVQKRGYYIGSGGMGVCEEACEFVKRLRLEAGVHLNGDNLTSVLVEVGTLFHGFVHDD
jgi:hypothetical protein